MRYDRIRLLLSAALLLALTLVVTPEVFAASAVINDGLGPGSSTYGRTNLNCNNEQGNDYYFDSFRFTVDQTGNYDITLPQEGGPGNVWVFLYSGGFSSGNPESNCVTGNDTGIAITLQANSTYYAVVTLQQPTQNNAASSTYRLRIQGPGNINIGGSGSDNDDDSDDGDDDDDGGGGGTTPVNTGSGVCQAPVNDGRLNCDIAAPVVAYCSGGGVSVYDIIGGSGVFSFSASNGELSNANAQALGSGQEVLVKQGGGNQLFATPFNSFRVQGPYDNGQLYSFTFAANRCGALTGGYVAPQPAFQAPQQQPVYVPQQPVYVPPQQPVIIVPQQPAPGGCTYIVQRGDTVFRIGLRYGLTVSQISALNGLYNPNLIYAGQPLRVC